MDKIETTTNAAYTAYCEAVGGKAYNGDTLPTWEEFAKDETKRTQADAWRKAVKAALAVSYVLSKKST